MYLQCIYTKPQLPVNRIPAFFPRIAPHAAPHLVIRWKHVSSIPPSPYPIPLPSLLRRSSVAPPFHLPPPIGGGTEEQRRRDGGGTAGLRWQLPGTVGMAAFCQARNAWRGGIKAGCSGCRQAHPCDRKREFPEETSPVVASARFPTASESLWRIESSEAGSPRARSRVNRLSPCRRPRCRPCS